MQIDIDETNEIERSFLADELRDIPEDMMAQIVERLREMPDLPLYDWDDGSFLGYLER